MKTIAPVLSSFPGVATILTAALLALPAHLAGQTPAVRFDVNDISWLLPPPKRDTPGDVSKLISVTDIKNEAGDLSLTENAFQQFVQLIGGEAGMVNPGSRINLPLQVRSNLRLWKIAAFRVDPSAPGCSDDVIAELGSAPQIRLIAHPVEIVDGKVKSHDIALHILYSFLSGADPQGEGNFPLLKPNTDALKQIVADLAELKAHCRDSGVETSGVPLGVHPGFKNATLRPDLQKKVVAFLNKHVGSRPPSALAIMGLPNDFEPWIFVATVSKGGGPFVAIDSPGLVEASKKAIQLSFQPPPLGVSPAAASNNLNPPTKQMVVPVKKRRGVSTDVLFKSGLNKNAPAVIGKDENNQPVLHPVAKNRDIPDIVANPAMSHFFNTDCISCHTETTRTKILGLPHGQFAFEVKGTSGLDRAVEPTDKWNLRNFGWFQSAFGSDREIKATATTRCLNETAEAVEFINQKVFGAAP